MIYKQYAIDLKKKKKKRGHQVVKSPVTTWQLPEPGNLTKIGLINGL